MPRFFFDVFDSEDCPDLVGTDLPDRKAACREGVRFVEQLIEDDSMRADLGRDWRLVVRDGADVVLTLSITT